MSDKQDEVLASSTANRRRVPRRRSFLGAQIIFRNGNCSMTCLIADVSETGALIRPLDMVLCPNKFVLRPRFDPPRECEVVWRKGELRRALLSGGLCEAVNRRGELVGRNGFSIVAAAPAVSHVQIMGTAADIASMGIAGASRRGADCLVLRRLP